MEPQVQTLSPMAGDGAARPQKSAGHHLGFGMPSADGRVLLGRDIEIFPDRPLQQYASFGTQAFEAKDKHLPGTQIALLCDRSLGPRATNVGSYKNLRSPNAVKLIDSGIVYWPLEQKQVLVLVIDMPPTRRLMQTLDSKPHKISEDRIVSAMIRPLLQVLVDLRSAGMIHGGITPDNIFIDGADGMETVILGEGLSSAPFFRHSALSETLERGMAQPSGRGGGTSKNDLYSLGVCVALALRGDNPFAGKSEVQIAREKLEQGSFSILAGREKMSAILSEFLRAVLNDDEKQRWDLDDAMRWLEGRHPGNKQTQIAIKAARPFVFKDEKYWDIRSLSIAFAADVTEAASTIDKGQFELWLKRNFESPEMDERLKKIWSKEHRGTQEVQVATACLAMDPRAPVRYRGLSLFPQGFGTALAEAMSKDMDIQPYAELIAMQFLSGWVQQRFEETEDATTYIMDFEKCRNFLSQKMPGYGIERAVYLMNREAVCMSQYMRNYFVFSPGHLLLALEQISKTSEKPDTVLDRHMMAFISVREPKMIDPHLGHIISRDRSYQLVGTLRTLAALQRRFQTGPVPGIAAWMMSMMSPAIEKYNDRDLRQEISKRLAALVPGGNLLAILELVDTEGLVQNDTQRFIMARQEFVALTREGQRIVGGLKKRRFYGLDAGRQVAMVVSAILSAFCIMGFLLVHFTGG